MDFTNRPATVGSDSLLTLFFPVESISQVEELCRQIYFPIRPASIGRLSLTMAMLLMLLFEFQVALPGIPQPDIDAIRLACQEGFLAGVESYEVIAIPSYEHCLLLHMAVSFSILSQHKSLSRT